MRVGETRWRKSRYAVGGVIGVLMGSNLKSVLAKLGVPGMGLRISEG